MNSFKGVLFDLDGTLLDTANDLGEALNFVLAKYNRPLISREKYRPVASDGAKGLLELGFGNALAQFDYELLREEFLTYYHENIATYTHLYDGISELITMLDDLKIPWGIVTNKPIGLTLRLLPFYEKLHNAKSVLGGDSLTERKPHPAPLIKAAEEIGVDVQDCIYVGDAPRDILAGNRAGMYSVVALWGYISDVEQCDSWGADAQISQPMALKSLLS